MSQLYSRNGRWVTLESMQKEETPVEIVPEVVVEKEVKLFTCDVCGKECKSQWHLDKHSGSHVPEAPVSEAINSILE